MQAVVYLGLWASPRKSKDEPEEGVGRQSGFENGGRDGDETKLADIGCWNGLERRLQYLVAQNATLCCLWPVSGCDAARGVRTSRVAC